MTFDAAARRLQGTGARPDRRRLRSAAGRDDRRHAERQGGDRRDRGAVRRTRTPVDERLPLMISVTITDRSGRTLSGQTIDAFWVSIAHAKPFSVGINCALGARDMRPYLAELARIADCYVSCYPNAGLPNAFGDYDEQPSETGAYLREFADQRLRQHRRRLLRHDAGSHQGDCRRRRRTAAARRGRLSNQALERALHAVRRPRDADDPARQSNFQMIGERTNVTGSLKFARLIKAGDYADRDRGGARAGARRRQPDRRQHGRGHARLRAGDDRTS